MADSNPGLQHQAGNAPDRDMGAHPIGVDRYERPVRDVDLCTFDKDQCCTFLEWNRLRRRQTWKASPHPPDQHQPAAPGFGPAKSRRQRRQKHIGVGHGDLPRQVENTERRPLTAPAAPARSSSNLRQWFIRGSNPLAAPCRVIQASAAACAVRFLITARFSPSGAVPEEVHHYINPSTLPRALRPYPSG